MEERIKKCMRMKRIFDDAAWWFDICVGNITDNSVKLSGEEILECLSELKKIYDNKWYREFRGSKTALGPCPIAMMGGIQSPIFSIVRLGQNLKTLGGVDNLDSELIERLKRLNTFLDASIEVEVGACFVEAGYKVEPYPILPSGKKCDMRVRGENDWIYIEITHLRPSKRDFKLNMEFTDKVHRVIPEEISGIIKFAKPLALQPDKLIDKIAQKIEEEYTRSGLPIKFKNATVKVELRKREKGRGLWVEGLSFFPPKDEGRHLIERALSEYEQLPEEGFGVIIVNPGWLLAPQVGEGMVERLKGLLNPNLHTRVSGIIFSNKRAERSGIIKTVPSVVINPYAKRRCDHDIERLAEALFKYPEWM